MRAGRRAIFSVSPCGLQAADDKSQLSVKALSCPTASLYTPSPSLALPQELGLCSSHSKSETPWRTPMPGVDRGDREGVGGAEARALEVSLMSRRPMNDRKWLKGPKRFSHLPGYVTRQFPSLSSSVWKVWGYTSNSYHADLLLTYSLWVLKWMLRIRV